MSWSRPTVDAWWSTPRVDSCPCVIQAEGIHFVKVRTAGDPPHLPARQAYEKVGFDIALPGVEYFQRL